MRQVGDDLRVNPFETYRVEFIAETPQSFKDSQHYNVFRECKVQERMLKFCAAKCPSDWSNETEACANACSQKFLAAINMHKSQKD